MFMDMQHISNDEDSFDDGDNEFIEGKEGVIKIGAITTTSENEFIMDGVGGSNEDSISNVLVEKAIASLSHIMQEITKECKQGGVTLFDHATSHMTIVASNIQNIAS